MRAANWPSTKSREIARRNTGQSHMCGLSVLGLLGPSLVFWHVYCFTVLFYCLCSQDLGRQLPPSLPSAPAVLFPLCFFVAQNHTPGKPVSPWPLSFPFSVPLFLLFFVSSPSDPSCVTISLLPVALSLYREGYTASIEMSYTGRRKVEGCNGL